MANINKFWKVLSLVMAGSLACSHQALRSYDKDRIYNGHNAVSGQFPYFVYIEVDIPSDSGGGGADEDTEGEYDTCGGALIGDQWVLTAAHCVSEAHPVDIYLGSVNDNYEQEYRITSDKIWIHPGFEKLHNRHDVALLRIPETVSCDTIDVIRLPKLMPSSEHRKYVNEYALTAGSGMINSVDFAKKLQWTRLMIIDNDDCSKYLLHIVEEMICAQSFLYPASPSLGDSGGPLVLESTGELVGITVAVSTSGVEKGYPAVFARVTDYVEWIKLISGIYY